MSITNISLPDTFKRFVDVQVQTGGYSSASEYICEFILADQQRKLEQKLDGLFVDGIEAGQPIAADAAFWSAQQQALATQS